jgi:chondroitin-sulfate-ABC endolyase/exolyase
MRGMKKGIEANEAYAVQQGNTMGRYINYGQIQVFTHDNVMNDGFPAGRCMTHGWDYNFWPGTTVRVIPHTALRQHFKNVEATTTEYFAGGTSLDGNGIFGMKLQEELPQTTDPLRLGPPLYWLGNKEYKKRCKDSMYDTSFRARKSMFFFENRIIALGSGIFSNDGEHHAVTTLFQNAIQPQKRNNFIDNTGIKKVFPLEKTYAATCWMISLADLGYYVPKGNDLLKISRKLEKKPYYLNWYPEAPQKHNQIEPNEGEIELAYFDHGKAPQNGTYEYCILIKADKAMMQDFTAKMSKPETALYKVLAKDNCLHAIYDVSSATTAYVVFETGNINVRGILKSVDKPCMVMIRELGYKIRVSLYNPDFDNYEKFGSPVQNGSPVKMHLNGKWKLTDANNLVSAENESTFIVHGKNAVPVIFELEKQ